MRKIHVIAILLLYVGVSLLHAERKTCIDFDWKFYYGDGSNAVGNASVTRDWRTLDLPHDWSVETEAAQKAGGTVIGPFSSNSIGGYQTGHTVGGEGWYYKKLHLSKEQTEGRHNELYFEGAYNQSDVYVNGAHIYNNVYGYSSFRVDASRYLHEGDNDILVRVRNEGNNTRWYAGSGIYRHVWFVTAPSLYADEWETFIQPDEKRVTVSTMIVNESGEQQKAEVRVVLRDAEGNIVQKKKTSIVIGGSSKSLIGVSENLQWELPMRKAKLWSPESPYLYSAEIIVRNTKTGTEDRLQKKFGMRTLSFSADSGFSINGKQMLLQGGCIHHDNGLLGAAAYDDAELRKLKLLQAQGYNAVRCSHNIPSDNFLDVCDSLGILVIDEAFDQWLRKKNTDDYHNYFREHCIQDVQTMVKRDRNHPCIIMWSIGNEIPGRIEPDGLEAAENLRQAVRQYDTSRPVTAAICSWDEGDEWNSAGHGWDMQDEKAFLSLDVGGYNYLYDKYEHDHGTHPDRIMFGAESYPKHASQNWDLVERLPYVIGDFVWTAMDYLGEAGIGSASVREKGNQSMFQQWSWFNGWCGDIDLIGEKKPQSYYRDVVWRRSPITMATARTVPAGWHESISWWGWQLEQQSWTYPECGAEDMMVVNVYSRAGKVRLYINDSIAGDAPTNATYHAGFRTRYIPGTLRAVNLDADGKEIRGEEFVLTTTGKPAAIRLTSDKATVRSNGTSLAYVTIELIDDMGRVVISDSERKVEIKVEGDGILLASGNASPNDMESFRSTTPRLYNGRALAIVKSTTAEGSISITVTSDGLPTITKQIESIK